MSELTARDIYGEVEVNHDDGIITVWRRHGTLSRTDARMLWSRGYRLQSVENHVDGFRATFVEVDNE